MQSWILPTILFFVGLVPVVYFVVNARFSRRRSKNGRVPPSDPQAVTIIVPVHAEPIERFDSCLRSVVSQGSRVVVVGDGSYEPYASRTRAAGAEFLALPEQGGKKRALAAGLERVSTPFVLFVDSDTVLPEGGVRDLTRYFGPAVGGVGANLLVRDTGTLAAGSAEFVERSREVVLRAMSSRGNVMYLDGACMMFRTELIREFVRSPEFLDLKVLGRPSRLGDDWLLTDHVLSSGFRTVKAFDVGVMTEAPTTLSGFVRRNVRWARSSWIRFGRYLMGKGPQNPGRFYRLELLGTYALPLVSLGVVLLRLPFILHGMQLWLGDTAMAARHAAPAMALRIPATVRFHGVGLLQTAIGLVGTGTFLGAVADRLPRHRRLRTLACGALGSGLLFVTMIYGLATFWRSPAWRSPTGSPAPSTVPPSRPTRT